MRTIKASLFKAKCLALLDQVNQNGKPLCRLAPFRTPAKSLFGLHQGVVNSSGNIVAPLDIPWEPSNDPPRHRYPDLAG